MTKPKFDETYAFKISMKIGFFWYIFSIKIPFFRVLFTIGRVAPYYSSLPRTVWETLVCAPVKPTDGDTSDSDEFYLQLQEQIA